MTVSADAQESEAPPPSTRPRRRPWSLQTRLIVTVTAIVALILVGVAVVTSTILGRVMHDSLDARVESSARQVQLFEPGLPPTVRSAYDVLSFGRQPPGFLLVVRDGPETTGAYVDEDSEVMELTDAQLEQIVSEVAPSGFSTVEVEGIGAYRVVPIRAAGTVGVAGLPENEVNATLAAMLTTIGIVTAVGLLALAGAVAVVIRASLRPLRAVAETATRVAGVPMDRGEVSIAERVPAEQADDRTEIGRVGAALNRLLDHVDESLDARQRNEERMRRFVADASHELRTPLASIRGYSELSLRDRSLAETTASSLERIQAQSVRMTALVEDLLLLARLDEGQELVFGSVDLSRMASEAIADARAAGPGHRWTLDVDPEPVVVAGDTGRLHQVVVNLLANARVHTPEGTAVTLSVSHDGQHAVIRVSDDGPGVDPAIAQELFERFSRADRSRARKTGGTGLGLSIARAIVTAHGGTISVQSTPGDTVFEVRLPARPDDPAASDDAAPAETTGEIAAQ
ncbi:HAMP domain-containing sensor histidine kinase [Microbacterium awajiense]|uniref:histidine kinase n=1 Tax=Microbacterium awajiense TaxID=415214 RepID=A0ABP7ACH7_9MICO